MIGACKPTWQLPDRDTQPQLFGDSAGPFTVGDRAIFRCSCQEVQATSDELVGLSRKDGKPIKVSENIALLAPIRVADSVCEIQVTSYVPTDHQLSDYQLVVGEQKIDFEPFRIEFVSVLDPNQPSPTPYPPYGGISLDWPLIVWWLIGGLTFLMATLLGFWLRRLRKKKRTRLRKEKLLTSRKPRDEMAFQVRNIIRQIDFSEKVPDLNTRISAEVIHFFIREFEIPIDEQLTSASLRQLRKALKNATNSADLLNEAKIIIKEVRNLKRSQNVAQEAARDFLKRAMRFAENIVEAKKK
ncbi:MAG: hypothetical protein COT74_00900 [Bdellovibrionales bacterium CG10_big_fil_rev_8_21_14_0_10_45_34]|nr:MAG: hypothetical protein COT74_00900 [Bdellovibrionales bacterium CG10_big_fil_rev_8_21_14_0_10_45_34]